MTAEIWKYLMSGRASHLFVEDTKQSGICGRRVHWASTQTWQEDEAGLKRRYKCERCLLLRKKRYGY